MEKVTWFDIEYSSGISKMQKAIKEKHGTVPESLWDGVFDIVSIYFSTWDNRVFFQSNSDIQYAPCLFVWYVKHVKGIDLKRPIDIMRIVYQDFKPTDR